MKCDVCEKVLTDAKGGTSAALRIDLTKVAPENRRHMKKQWGAYYSAAGVSYYVCWECALRQIGVKPGKRAELR